MKYDFDNVIDRNNTYSLKYDCAITRGMPSGLLPMWVADMDFQTPPEVISALKQKAEHGIFGYSEPGDGYFGIIKEWYQTRYHWEPKKEWHINTPGVVFALAIAIRAYTKERDAVLIQPPVYYPFKETILKNNRRLVTNPLILNEITNGYEIDFTDFEQKIQENKVRLFVLCSPHNPVGRVWTDAELKRIGEICHKYNVIVVSDEIHSDFVYSGSRHKIFSGVSYDFHNNSVICLAPSKTFNLAGLQYSDIFIADETLRRTFTAELNKTGYSQLNTFGIVAAEAAYRFGAPWLDELLEYLNNNRRIIDNFLQENLPDVKLIRSEGTYLAWLDFRAYNFSQKELDAVITQKAKLWLDSGVVFGTEGAGFQRLNFACPKQILEQALYSLKTALRK